MTAVRPPPPLRADDGVRVAPGETGSLVVTVRNDADEPRDFAVRAVGLDPSWTSGAVPCPAVAPGATAQVSLPVHVPTGSPAGRFPFVVVAEPRHTLTSEPTGPALDADALLVVGDASRLMVSLSPGEPSGVQGRRFKVVLENRTAEALRVTLDLDGPAGLYLSTRRSEIDVPAGATVRVRASAAVDRRLTGQARRLPFVVTAQGHTTPVRVAAVFRAKPLLSTGVTKLFALLALISVWGGLSLLAVNKISQTARDRTSADLVAGAPEQGGDADEDAGADGDDSGDGEGDVDGGTPDSTTSARAARRINGVVTGDDPSGVTVSLQPTSLVDEEATGAQLLGGIRRVSATGKIPAAAVAYAAPTIAAKRSTVTGADGSWAFADVDVEGYYLLTFAKAGHTTRRVVVQQRADTALEPLEVPLAAGTGRLSGTVVTEGRPVPGATVVITDGTVTVTTTTRTTGDVGTWSVDGLSTPGSFLVTASAERLATASALVALRAGGAEDVDLSLQRGVQSLVGTVTATTATGRTAEAGGVTVTVTDGTTTRRATTITRSPAGTATPVGSYVLPDLPLGRWTVSFTADGYATRTEQVVLDGTRSDRDLTAHLITSGATVRGAVTDESGTGLVGAGLVLTGTEGTYKLTSADGGSFAVAGVVPGTYVLTAEKAGYESTSAGVDTTAGATTEVPLTLTTLPDTVIPETSFIRGRVVDARNGGLVLCPATDDSCLRVSVDDREPVAVAPTAEYTVPGGNEGLEPGLHTVRVTAPGYEGGEATVQVPEGGIAVAPVIALYPRVAIVGKITPGAPAPLPPTCVLVVPVDGSGSAGTTGCALAAGATPPACQITGGVSGAACALVGPTGDYALEGLDRFGTYAISVTAVGPAAKDWIPVPAATVSLSRGETKRYDAQLDRKAQLRVLLRLPGAGNGLQLPNAPVTVEVFTADAPAGTPALATVTSGVVLADGSTDLGQALVTGLADGRLRLLVSGKPLGPDRAAHAAQVDAVEVGTNSTTEVTAVLTPTQPNQLVGRVVWKQDGAPFPVVGARVKLTGVTRYDGTTEVPESVVVTTGADGCFAVTRGAVDPTGVAGCGSWTTGAVGALALVTSRVDVEVEDVTGSASGGAFEGTAATVSAGTGSLVEVALATPVRDFTGQLLVDGVAPTKDVSATSVRVTTPALGSGTIVITPSADGTLRWEDSLLPAPDTVHPGTYKVLATLPDHDDAVGTLACRLTAAGLPDGDCRLTLSLGTHVGLTVEVAELGDAGALVEGAVVTASGGDLPTTTLTVPPGARSVTFPGLSAAAGAVTITVRAPGYATRAGLQETLVAGVPKTVTVELTRLNAVVGTVYGKVGDQLSPLGGVTLTATSSTGTVFKAVTGSTGSYRLTGSTTSDGLLDGTWTVVADGGSGFGTAAERTASVVVPGTGADTRTVTQDFTLSADPVSLRVRVVDDVGGAALTDAKVVLTNAAGTAITTTQDPPGTFLATGLVPTLHVLEISAPNRSPLLTTVVLEPGIPTTDITIALPNRLNAVAVRVLGQKGTATPAALAGALVTVTPVNPAGAALPTATTGADGQTQIDGLGDGTYDVTIAGPVGTAYSPVTRSVPLRLGQIAFIEATLQLPLPAATVTVTSSTGDSMVGALVELQARGNGAVGLAGQQAAADPVTATTGTTTFTQVIPGDYTIVTSGPGGHLASRTDITVPDTGGTFPVTVQERRLSLTLKAPTGETPTTVVTVAPAGVPTGAVTLSLVADGTAYTQLYIPSTGDFTVTATAPGYATATYSGSNTTVTLDLVPNATGALKVTVREPAPSNDVVYNATITVEGSGLAYNTGTKGSGSVLIGGLPVGDTILNVVLEDGRTATGTGTVVAKSTTDVTITMPAPEMGTIGALSIAVTDNGGTAFDALVTVETVSQVFSTGPLGTSVLVGGLSAGSKQVTVALSDGRRLTVASPAVVVDTTTPMTVNVGAAPSPDTGTLEVTVLRDSTAVSGATVAVSGVTTSYTTDGTGKVTIAGLTPGEHAVTAAAADGTTVTKAATVVASTTTPVTLTLPSTPPASATLTVQVRNGTTPVPDATVVLSGTSGTTGSATGVTGSTGNVTITGLAPGSYLYSATTPDGQTGASSTAVSLAAGETKTVSLSVSHTGSVRVTVERSSGGGSAEGATVSLSTTPVMTATAGTGGVALLQGVPRGTYTVTATLTLPAGNQTGTATVSVIAGALASVTVTVAP